MQLQHGSGKTAVLVERIINKILKEKIDIDKILVVTFTNAAASEMRERILIAIDKKIEENPDDVFLQRQIVLLNKANICTIHAFCLEVIRNNFFELDIPANFRIAETSEIELLKQDVIEELFEEKYLMQDEGFIKLINIYTGYRGDEPLKEIILSLYKYIQSNPFPIKWLNEKVSMFNIKDDIDDFSKTQWGEILLEYIHEELEDGIVKLKKIKKDIIKFTEMEKYAKVISIDIENLEMIKQNMNSWDTIFNLLKDLKWEKWPVDRKVTLEIKEQAKKIRDDVKKTINTKFEKIIFYNSEEALNDIKKMYPILKELEKMVIEFSDKFSTRKREKNIIDFSDIEHFALQILIKQNSQNEKFEKTDIAKNYEDKFIEIAIDEYQDSNLVQEYILNSISKGNNIFMVGDVKQSIYKFRQARPELFLEKYEKYPLKGDKKESNLKIKLFKNFRSRKNVLDLTNLVFQNIMSKEAGDIIYNEEEYLNLGANYENPKEEEINFGGMAELHIIDVKNNENDEKDESNNITVEEETNQDINIIENNAIEAKFVASRIKKLIDFNYYIYDKKVGYRKISYKDIVILLRVTSNLAPIYEKELITQNIPVFSDTSSEFLESIEIQTILAVLKILDNPTQEIPLITVMRSNIGGFTDEELIQIRICDKDDDFYNALIKSKIQVKESLAKKIDNFLLKLDEWRKKSSLIELDELIWLIYTETNFYHYVGLMPNGALRQANLKMLFEKAKQYEDASFKGLYNFINFIDKVHNGNNDMASAKIIGENENVVRIMSIHKSKGLEFPVVFLCGTGKGFNLRDLNDPILFHQDIGLGPKFIDEERRIEYNTLAKEAIKIKSHQETLSEEMRILYVALTRAKEKLIITGISKDAKKSLKQKEELLNMYNMENNENESDNLNKINSKLIKKYKTYLDWIELVYIFNKDTIEKIISMDIHSKENILNQVKEKEVTDETSIIEKIKEKAKNIEYDKEIISTLNWQYKYIDSIDIPTKMSVTKLKELKQENIIDEILKNEETKLEKLKNIKQKILVCNKLNDENQESLKLEDKPKFLLGEEKITSSKKGTLMHLCMQKMKESNEYSINDIKDLVFELVQKEIIMPNEAEAINIKQLFEYTKSDLWMELQHAKEIHKEEPFYLNISAKEVFNSNTDDWILVQGIIDLYYIDKKNELVLVDYKTDYINYGEEKVLIEKYKKQLELYKKALENSLNKKVAKVYIYSTVLNKTILM